MNDDNCKTCRGEGEVAVGLECPDCRGTGHAHACSNCGIIDIVNDGTCTMCDADIPVRPDFNRCENTS